MKDHRNRMALRTVEGLTEAPSVETVAKLLGVLPEDIDQEYGILLIDPNRGTYCVQVKDNLPDDQPSDGKRFDGPWSSPKIDTFQ